VNSILIDGAVCTLSWSPLNDSLVAIGPYFFRPNKSPTHCLSPSFLGTIGGQDKLLRVFDVRATLTPLSQHVKDQKKKKEHYSPSDFYPQEVSNCTIKSIQFSSKNKGFVLAGSEDGSVVCINITNNSIE
jgi:WD40 repeat protein